jgi:aquaporin Z
LTLVAAGADVVESVSGGAIGHTARYLAPGFLVSAMIWSLSGISGAHINPAVTLAFMLRGHFPIARAAAYWAVQFAGAVAASGVLRVLFGPSIARGVTHPGAGYSDLVAASWEALLTLLLLLVILGTAEQEAIVGKNAALAVGITVAACGLFSSPISGASMNPARSFGPQLVSADFSGAWIYFAGPAIGAAFAVAIVWFILGAPRGSERKAAKGNRA